MKPVSVTLLEDARRLCIMPVHVTRFSQIGKDNEHTPITTTHANEFAVHEHLFTTYNQICDQQHPADDTNPWES